MARKDFLLFGALAGLILALTAPAWFMPSTALANFGDLYSYHYPLRHLVIGALQSGRLPFWNPYIFSGLPMAANPQSVLFYPVTLLCAVLPLGLALTWDCVFHLMWAGFGMALLARRQGMGSLGAVLLAGLYVLSPFLIYRLTEGIPTLAASLAWAPWCWLFWLCGSPLLLSASWALQFLAGHPQFMAINALGMTAWALLHKRRQILLSRLLVAGAATLALTALQWLPLAEFLSRSVRRGWPSIYTTAYSLDLRMLASWFYPNAAGNPLDGTYAGPPSVFFETAGVFIGLAGAALAFWGLWRGPRARTLALIGLGLFLAAGGNNPIYRVLLKSPLGWLRTPARYLFLCLWGLLAAAARGWSALEKEFKPAAIIKVLMACIAILELASWDLKFLRVEDARPTISANAAMARTIGGQPFRVMTDPDLASPDKTMLYRAMNVNGYEAFYLGGYPEYAAKSEGRAAADASRMYLRRYDSPQMRDLGVRYFLSAAGQLRSAAAPLPLVYFSDEAGQPFAGDVRIEFQRPERWLVKGVVPPGASRIVAAQPLYPGWRAHLNGETASLELWDGLLQSLKLPLSLAPGAGFTLELDFVPNAWLLWVLLSVLAWTSWLWSQAERTRGALSL